MIEIICERVFGSFRWLSRPFSLARVSSRM